MLSLPFELVAVLQMLLAVVLGATVGFERALHGRPAGLRTHALVCVGSTMIMLTARGLASVSPEGSLLARITVDPGRIAAGIITGIGFLGAGSIIKSGDFVRGLTTAACLWFVAALGITIGEGFYLLSVVATAIALFVLIVLDRFEHRFAHVVYRCLRVVVPMTERHEAERAFREILSREGLRIQDTQYVLKPKAGVAQVIFRLRGTTRSGGSGFLEKLSSVRGVTTLEWR
ncbi:MAG: MgtC/SapB family protein [bacterium]|jgi:putative Mg2+ transporter-C (MgtC) family protein|nr:MgtC/SapB family protein [candidate division KSB1 bacterium]MDH7558964.1 MgtC/SapB family protein [bacterium]